MNNELSAESDLRNLITVDISETMIPEIELTNEELEAVDDIRFSDEMAATVAELPVFTDEQSTRYNDKMTMLAAIRADIGVLNKAVTDETVPEGVFLPVNLGGLCCIPLRLKQKGLAVRPHVLSPVPKGGCGQPTGKSVTDGNQTPLCRFRFARRDFDGARASGQILPGKP